MTVGQLGSLFLARKTRYHGGVAAKTRYRDVSKRAWTDWVNAHRKKWRTLAIYAALIGIGPILHFVFQGWDKVKDELPLVFFYALAPPLVWALVTAVWKLHIAPFHFLQQVEVKADTIAVERDELKLAMTDLDTWEESDEILCRCIELGEQLIRFTDSTTTWNNITEVHDRFVRWLANTQEALQQVQPAWASRFCVDPHVLLVDLAVPELCQMLRGYVGRLNQIQDRHRRRHPLSRD